MNADVPNRFAGPRHDPAAKEPPLAMSGAAGRRHQRIGNDDGQAGALFRLLPAAEQARLMAAITQAMRTVPREIRQRRIGHFVNADPACGAREAAPQAAR